MLWTVVKGFYYIVVTPMQLCAFVGFNYKNGIIILGIESVKMMIQVTCKVHSINRLLQHVSANICSHLYGVHTKVMLFTKCAINWNKSFLYITHLDTNKERQKATEYLLKESVQKNFRPST